MANAGNLLPPYINGRFVRLAKPERTFQAVNPARPGDVLAVAGWQKDLVGDVVDGMRAAQAKIRVLPFAQRLKIVEGFIATLRVNAEEIKSHMMLELARSRMAVDEEWALCENLFSNLPQFCKEALSEKTDKTGWSWSYAPLGLVLVSSNIALPVYAILSATLPALVAGNAVCIRPSLHCPLSASLLASAFHQAAFPEGLVQLVYGDLEVYRRLLLTHQFDTVLYTGGEESLEQIRRDLSTHQNSRLVLCSGGKNAALVLPSASIDDAVAKVMYGACVDTGQRLEATGLAFVHKDVVAEFTEKFVKAIKAMPIGVRSDLNVPGTHVMGPLCSATGWERYLRFQGIAARESDETLRWGKPIDNPGNGYFVSPGVHFIRPDKLLKSVYASNAFFGPDVAIVPVESGEEAVTLLNEMNASRALAVHTSFDEEVRGVRAASNVPTVAWNAPTTALDPHLPTFGRGRAGNSHVTGVRFLFSTVYPKTLSLKSSLADTLKSVAFAFALLSAALAGLFSPLDARADYRKAVEGNDVVKGKFYPKSGRFQMTAGYGIIMNQSFIDTSLLQLGATYHFNEWHALNVEGFIGMSSDRGERLCVENFYFNEDKAEAAGGSTPCEPTKNTAPGDANDPLKRKPAYMAIRQINQMVQANYQWTPVYGKALWFLSAVGYLDFFTNIGAGLALSDYSKQVDKDESGANIADVGTSDPNKFGTEGRPAPEAQTSPMFSLGIGSRLYFAKHFLINADFRNFTVFGGNGDGGSDIMNFFAIWGGVGVIF